jgi:hypothetical protein
MRPVVITGQLPPQDRSFLFVNKPYGQIEKIIRPVVITSSARPQDRAFVYTTEPFAEPPAPAPDVPTKPVVIIGLLPPPTRQLTSLVLAGRAEFVAPPVPLDDHPWARGGDDLTSKVSGGVNLAVITKGGEVLAPSVDSGEDRTPKIRPGETTAPVVDQGDPSPPTVRKGTGG